MKRIILLIILLIILFFVVSFHSGKPDARLNKAVHTYINVWNGWSIDSLNAITSDNFQLRINPFFEPLNGRDKLKENIRKTRALFPDFKVNEKEIVMLGDTAMAVSWIISGTFKDPEDSLKVNKKTEAPGFSIIFFNKGIITGEWIGYSDLTWYKGMGFELTKPEKVIK